MRVTSVLRTVEKSLMVFRYCVYSQKQEKGKQKFGRVKDSLPQNSTHRKKYTFLVLTPKPKYIFIPYYIKN